MTVSFSKKGDSEKALLENIHKLSLGKFKSTNPGSPSVNRLSLSKGGPLVITDRNRHIVQRWKRAFFKIKLQLLAVKNFRDKDKYLDRLLKDLAITQDMLPTS